MSELWELVDAIVQGRGFVDRSADRKVVVTGADATRWLGDLVTADVATLEVGSSRRSLLLTPTGKIRADLLIARDRDGALLVMQTMDQPESVLDLLSPYVLSSDVRLEDVSDRYDALLLIGRNEIVMVPSPELPDRERELIDQGYVRVDGAAHETWRVALGDARMGVDFQAGALPAEAGLEDTIDFTKGCFLGQESVAKVRNLGHPPTVLRRGWTRSNASVGAPVEVTGDQVGAITSVAPRRGGGSVVIARVTWDAADRDLATGGTPLIPEAD